MQTENHQLYRYAAIIIPLALIIKFAGLFVLIVEFDSSYYLNIAVNFIERGGLTPYMWRIPQDANIVAGSGTGYGVLIQTLWLQTFGVTIISGRVLSYLAGAFMLVVMYWTVRRMWDARAALVTVMVASVSVSFLVTITLRMDALGLLSYTLVMLVHIYAVYNKNNFLHVAAGVLAVASAEVHILGTIYLFGIAFYYFVDFVRAVRRERRFVWTHGAIFYYLGALVAGIIYIIVRILPNPTEYFLIARTCNYCDRGSIGREIVRYVVISVMRPLDVLLIAFAIRCAFVRRRETDIHYLLLVLGVAISMGVFSPPQLPIYTTHLWPVMFLGVGIMFTDGYGRKGFMPLRRLHWIGYLATITLVIFSGFMIFLLTRPGNPDPRFEWVRDNVPTDAVVVAPDRFYYLLIDHHLYLSTPNEVGFIVATIIREETARDLYNREQPVAIVADVEELPALHEYTTENNFIEVLPDLWVAPGLIPET